MMLWFFWRIELNGWANTKHKLNFEANFPSILMHVSNDEFDRFVCVCFFACPAPSAIDFFGVEVWIVELLPGLQRCVRTCAFFPSFIFQQDTHRYFLFGLFLVSAAWVHRADTSNPHDKWRFLFILVQNKSEKLAFWTIDKPSYISTHKTSFVHTHTCNLLEAAKGKS